MSFLDNHGLSSLWNKIQDKLATKADSSHDHDSISGTAANVTGVVGIANGGTGASNSFAAQMNLNMVHSHDIAASDKNDWRNKALAQIKENAKAGGFQCGSIGWQGVQFGQYFATTSGETTDRILALIYNSAGTNWALEVWRYEDSMWKACAVKGASLQTMPEVGYGTADQRPSAGVPGRIYFQKV